MLDSCSPTQIMGDTRIQGGWDSCMVQGMPMLVLRWAGSSGQENHCRAMILGAFGAPSTPLPMPKDV